MSSFVYSTGIAENKKILKKLISFTRSITIKRAVSEAFAKEPCYRKIKGHRFTEKLPAGFEELLQSSALIGGAPANRSLQVFRRGSIIDAYMM